jgi:SAM-dependent methyltransferase
MQPRVLVFVVAYRARRFLQSVFERVPASLLNHPEVDFLCIDDASGDDGPDVLRGWLDARGIRNVRVYRNRVNQGYGGNQKMGYRYAVEGRYDLVILLHGDGQYAPELLPEFIATFAARRPDVILGTRMHSLRSARAGGMPFYKLVGNRILTVFQNALTGLGLSEYHTGYRAFSTAFLRRAPFEVNTNDFHFDTEILLQAAYLKAPIVEIPIPTHYGEEISHVNGLSYALNVFLSTVQYRCHQIGILCSLKYRGLADDPYVDKTGFPYSSHATAIAALARLEPAPRRVLDIGCGSGHLVRRLKALGMDVTGIDRKPVPGGDFAQFFTVDLETEPLPVDPSEFDAVLLLDVIEHLANPEQFLLAMRHASRRLLAQQLGPTLVLSTPNVAFIAMRLNLLFGRFSYAERGILDITHKRLFTRGTFRTLLADCGYELLELRPIAVPFGAILGGRLGRVLEWISHAFARLWPAMFAFQFMAICRMKPSIASLWQGIEPIELPAPSRDSKEPAPRARPQAGAISA